MSRTTTRAAVADWITASGVAGITTVFPSLPKQITGKQITGGAPYGCAVAVQITSEGPEVRRALPALQGIKRVDSKIELQLFFRSSGSSTNEDPAVVAMGRFDAIVDGLKARIRSSKTFGSSSIFEVDDDIAARYGTPQLNGNQVEIWASVTFTITEMITA